MLSALRNWYRRIGLGRATVKHPVVAGEYDSSWDLETDVAVIGFGGAGAAAAIEASEAGARVSVVDRFNGGGSTKISGGIYYAGGGTAIQRQAGVEDDPDNMFRYLKLETGDVVCEDTLRRFCEDSPENFDWLLRQGVPFDASLCPYKTSYPSNDYYFYYSGNESFPPWSEVANPAPRGHRAHGRGVSGAALFGPLHDSARDKGVQILTQHRAVGLVTDLDGRVTGVQLSVMTPGTLTAWLHRQLYAALIFSRYATMFAPMLTWLARAGLERLESIGARSRRLRARRGVVISAGGFFFNRGMVEHYAPDQLAGTPLGTIGDDGSGILLGQSVGAATGHMDNVSQWRFINPPESFARGVLVSSQGRRVCNEMLYGAQLAERIMERADGQAWLLIDSALVREALREIGPHRAMWFQSAAALLFLLLARKRAATLPELAHKLGMDPAVLAATVAEYNAHREQGNDPMGKPADHLAQLGEGKWYALDCRVDGLVRNPSITLGGLEVDENSGAVIHRNGHPIPGLYAAGRSAVGIASHSYVSGLSIAGCIFSGRRAGHNAAA